MQKDCTRLVEELVEDLRMHIECTRLEEIVEGLKMHIECTRFVEELVENLQSVLEV